MFIPPAKDDGEEYELRGDVQRLYDVSVDGKIVTWRVECFMALDFTYEEAKSLAMRRDVDRVEVERMRAAGASPKLVLEILAHD